MDRAQARQRSTEEIERIVILSVRSGSIVRTGYYAGMLAATYRDAGYSVGLIMDAIAQAASQRGIPVEIARPGSDVLADAPSQSALAN